MRANRWIAAVLLFFTLALVAHADDVRVSVAANMQTPMTAALIPAYEKLTGDTVTASYGSTKMLAQQIQTGAPVDVFIAADTATVLDLESKGNLVKGSSFVYAVGRLVIWSRADSAHHPHSIADLADSAYVKIAVANPTLAPYGQAAMESLESGHLTASVQPRIVQSGNIAEALAFAKSGNADVAFTALSLVIDDKTDPYIIVPDKMHKPIAQACGLVSTSASNAAALRFLKFLQSRQAQDILKGYGYSIQKHAQLARGAGQPAGAWPAA